LLNDIYILNIDAHAMVSHTNTYGVTIYNVVLNSETVKAHTTSCYYKNTFNSKYNI